MKAPDIRYDQVTAQPRVVPISSQPSVTPNKIITTSSEVQVQEANSAGAIRVGARAAIATAALFYTILTTDYNAIPSMPQPGFLVRDNTTVNPGIVLTPADDPSTDVPIVAPIPPGTPTKVYEIGGWDVLTMKWQTLKYGVASTDYDTYFGAGNRRPDSQLEGLRNKYPSLVVTQITLAVLPDKSSAHALETLLVQLYRMRNIRPDPSNPVYGLAPPEQKLPLGK